MFDSDIIIIHQSVESVEQIMRQKCSRDERQESRMMRKMGNGFLKPK